MTACLTVVILRRHFLDELHRKKAELVGQLALANDETRMVRILESVHVPACLCTYKCIRAHTLHVHMYY